jgi:hypothetical protein
MDEDDFEPSRGIKRTSSPSTTIQLQAVSASQRKFRGALPVTTSTSSGDDSDDDGSTNSHKRNMTSPRRQPARSPQGKYNPSVGEDLEL